MNSKGRNKSIGVGWPHWPFIWLSILTLMIWVYIKSYKGSREKKNGRIFKKPSKLEEKGTKRRTLVQKVVNLLTCMYMMFMLCIDLLYCFTWLCETCMNEWSSVSVFAMAISMLHETLSTQNFHNVNMSLCKASISCISIHLACTICIVCYWDSLKSHSPPTI